MPSGPLSSLEKFGVLARKFLHDTSNDFTAIGLNLHFIEKSIETDHPIYKDFQNLTVALKNLQANTRILLNWRRQLPDTLQSIPVKDLIRGFPVIPGWHLQPVPAEDLEKMLKVNVVWMASFLTFLAVSARGTIRCLVIDSPNDQCATVEQINLIFSPEENSPVEPKTEIEWALHRELAKLMGGGINLEQLPHSYATLFLPIYS